MGASGLLALALAGCGPVLPAGERVLGAEVPAVVIDGDGDGFARAVAVSETGRVAVAAPEAGRVEVYDRAGGLQWSVGVGPGAGEVLAWEGDSLLALVPGEGVVALDPDGQTILRAAAPDAAGFAPCPDGGVATGTGPVACGAAGVLALSCVDGGPCEVRLDDGSALDEVSAGSTVAFLDGVPCWSDVQAAVDDAPGEVRCRVDGEVELLAAGIAGEHLGQALHDGDEAAAWAAGRFTRWTGTPRGRIVPLSAPAPDGAAAWVVDRAADASPLTVAAGGGVVAVGVPGYSVPAPDRGRLYLVDLATLDAP